MFEFFKLTIVIIRKREVLNIKYGYQITFGFNLYVMPLYIVLVTYFRIRTRNSQNTSLVGKKGMLLSRLELSTNIIFNIRELSRVLRTDVSTLYTSDTQSVYTYI